MRSKLKLLVLFMALLVIAAGCSKSEPPKEAVQTALLNSMELQSYSFSTKLLLNEVKLPEQLLNEGDPQLSAIAGMLKDASLTVNGAYQADPMRLEMTLDLELKGDFSFSISVPVIMADDKLWVKVPEIPMLPLDGLSGKFIEIDLNKLAEEQGTELPAVDMDQQRKMVQDIMGVILKHFDEESYYSELKADQVESLPGELKPDQIVKFSITQDNFDDVITTVIDKALPELIELLLNNEQYRQTFQLSEEQLKEAQEQLKSSEGQEWRAELEKLKEQLKINELSMIGAIRDDYLAYQEMRLNFDITQEGQTSTLGLQFTSEYGSINEPIEFKQPIPTDAMTLDEVEALLNMGSLQGK